MLNNKSYFFQYTKSADSCCLGCKKIIQQDEVRVYRNDHYEIYPYPSNGWFHLKCFWSLEEVKDLNANDVMLEIDCRERNYETEYWSYQKHKIVKNNTQLSLHDGQNSCFYTSLAFYDSTYVNIMLAIDEMELMGIRKKLAAIAVFKDSMNASCTSTSSGYVSSDDLAALDGKKEQLSSTFNSDENIQLSTTGVSIDEEMPSKTTKDIEPQDVLDYLFKDSGAMFDLE